MTRKIPSLCLAALALAGCTYTASFNRLPYVDMDAVKNYSATRPARTAPAQIAFLKEYPKRSFVVLGTLHAPETEWTAHYTMDDLIQAMRVKAAEIGADAIVDFRSQENPTVHTVGSVNIVGGYGSGSMMAVPYKGLHAWGEAIIYIPADKKKLIESK